MGRFKLGSTVINLFAPGKVTLVEHLQNLSVTRLGEPLAVSTEAVAEPVVEPVVEAVVEPVAETVVEQDVAPQADDTPEKS